MLFIKQKTSYEMRISDWSSDVCSSDLSFAQPAHPATAEHPRDRRERALRADPVAVHLHRVEGPGGRAATHFALARHGELGRGQPRISRDDHPRYRGAHPQSQPAERSEEHTSELQSLMRISYAVFCSNKK